MINLSTAATLPLKATRDGYGEALVELGQKNPNVVVLTADLAESTRANLFQKQFPERFFELGVAEQNLMGVAAGLALSGKIPFLSSYAVFSPGRNWDQLRVSVCYSQANVKIAGCHTGLTVGEDGATHQGLEDIAITRVLPNLTVIVPCDYFQAKQATLAAAKHKGPVYIRLTREASPQFTTPENSGQSLSHAHTQFEIGKAQIFQTGKDVTLIACGPIMSEVLLAAENLAKKGIHAEIINLHTIKPLDEKTILTSLLKTGAAVTIEEHQVHAGMGSAVAEVVVQNLAIPMEIIGMPDHFGESGKPAELWKKYHLTAPYILHAVEKVLARKQG